MKKVLAIAMVLAMLIGSMPAVFAAASKYGDVDCDGDVSVMDATGIQLHVAKLVLIDEATLEYADVDDDNDVSVMDCTSVQMYVAGLIESFPAEENDIDYSNLVSDLSYDVVEYEDWRGTREAIFAVPKINLNGSEIAQINEEIANKFGSAAQTARKDLEKYGRFEMSDGLEYEWYYSNDVLSLIIAHDIRPHSTPVTDYIVYTISVSGRTRITQNDILAIKGITADEFYKQVQVALGHTYLNMYDGVNSSVTSSSSFKKQFNKTVELKNAKTSIAYLNSDGELCVKATVYTIAGSGMVEKNVNLENYQLNPNYNKYAG